MSLPFYDLKKINIEFENEINTALLSVFKSGHFILGENLKTFEHHFAEYCQSLYCLGVGNGLDALTLSLKAAGIGPGDLVALPAHTFIATALGVLATGATPYLVDIDLETYTISPSELEKANDPRIKAVIPVHLYGHPCHMDEINKIAKAKGWIVIEDNAQAHGALYKNRRTGSLGDLSATSFYPTKNLGALGDGGAITTHSKNYADAISYLRNYGQKEKYHHVSIGGNSRLDEIQAAVLDIKLKHLDQANENRNKIAQFYSNELKNVGDLILPSTAPDCKHVYHLFVIRTKHRDACQKFLQENGVSSMVHYPYPIHKHSAFLNLEWTLNAKFPAAEKACETILSLPLYPHQPEADLKKVCDTLKKFFTNI